MKTLRRPNKRASLTAVTSAPSAGLVCRAKCYHAEDEATCLPLLLMWLLLHASRRSLPIIPGRKEKAMEMYSTFGCWVKRAIPMLRHQTLTRDFMHSLIH